MRTLCDVCEAAPAQLFCAADEAALCRRCDVTVHSCNKLASRHVRLELAEPKPMPRCDICELAPAFFSCPIDGTALCLQCDLDAHRGGKSLHQRFLITGQRIQMPSQSAAEQLVDGSGSRHQGYENGTSNFDGKQWTSGNSQNASRNLAVN